ncbi:MAG: hypothetical protein NW226_04965 [Microscillaceae bacterium]|nr:hypothetical protein [Microscillaceae bacterium]
MSLLTFFKKRHPNKKEVNILDLHKDDICYYDNFKSPFKVIETGRTERGVYFVEIKNEKSGQSFIFVDNYRVKVENEYTLRPNPEKNGIEKSPFERINPFARMN